MAHSERQKNLEQVFDRLFKTSSSVSDGGQSEQETAPELSRPELSRTVSEADREPLYQLEILRMFRQRLRLNATLGLLLMPLFHLFYFFLAPLVARQTQALHGLIIAIFLLFLFFPSRIKSLRWAKAMAVMGYTAVCMSSSLVMAVIAQHPFAQAEIASIQLVLLAAHSQIMLSVVLLPLALWECLVLVILITLSLEWSSWWSISPGGSEISVAQIFVLLTTAIFVMFVAHFQSVLRRQAFDATFDLALSAAQLQALSEQDAVTGGFNRLYLEKTLALEISRATRFGHPLSVMMFDLDNFKTVNDTRGHAAGDEVLRVVAEAAALSIRDVDTVARYGGDEFTIVLPETEHDDALAVARRLQMCVQEKLRKSYRPPHAESCVTLSIGIITMQPTEPAPVERLIALADERLYEAKRLGKNRIAV